MPQTLLIVESPAKARTIGRYLGKDFHIAASVGHIRDLPAQTIGVNVHRDFKPMYINMRGKEKVIRELVQQAEKSERILIATDPDREGEAIAWHIAHVLKLDGSTPCRVSFNEITESAVRAAVEKPRPLDDHLIDSQQTRRILDRLVGYELSPLLWDKIRKGLSAGRVQSVATRMIVEREREIQAFIPEEYWILTAFLSKLNGTEAESFRARYHGRMEGDKLTRVRLKNEQDTRSVLVDIEHQPFSVRDLRKGNRKRQPSPPFTTSTLQQEASRRLGFTARRTMSVAQQLYEGVDLPGQGATALVSYIRTDSVRVSDEAAVQAKDWIVTEFGKEYYPGKPRRFSSKNAAQDAHEAIRPTHFDLAPDRIRDALQHDQYRLYKLIWDRFLASQMAPASIDTVSVDAESAGHIFRARGETIRFPGFLRVYGDTREKSSEADDGKERIPELEQGEDLNARKVVPEQKFTNPPPRYSEASLIRALEEKGIGRPSTYAPTISTILERNYVEKDQKNLVPTELGFVVTDLLTENFGDVVDPAFTAEMEKKLDTVEEGKAEGLDVLNEFYWPFHEQVEQASKTLEKVQFKEEPVGEKCPECETGDLVIKQGRYGKFIACNRFPECRYTRNMEVPVDATCPKCGSGIVERTSRKNRNRKFYTCDRKGSDPECDFISWDIPVADKKCDTCGSYMVQRTFRGQTQLRCGNRDCPTNARKKSSGSRRRPKKSDAGGDA